MKKHLIFLLTFLFLASPLKAIDLEGRTGVSVSGNWGLHAVAYVGIPLSSRFAVRSGLQFHTVEWDSYRPSDHWRIGWIVPVYASFRFPLGEKTCFRTDVGPYAGIGDEVHLGGAAEAGVEFGNVYVGAGYFQNGIGDTDYQFNFSVGYKFSL